MATKKQPVEADKPVVARRGAPTKPNAMRARVDVRVSEEVRDWLTSTSPNSQPGLQAREILTEAWIKATQNNAE